MKQVIIDDKIYTFKFDTKFFTDPEPMPALQGNKMHYVQARVRAAISAGPKFDPATIIMAQDAYCSTKDEFNLHTGRKTALLRALKAANFAADDREKFWEVFKKSLPKPKPSYGTLKRELKAALEQLAIAHLENERLQGQLAMIKVINGETAMQARFVLEHSPLTAAMVLEGSLTMADAYTQVKSDVEKKIPPRD